MLEATSIVGFVLAWGMVIVRVLEAVPASRLLWLAPVSLALQMEQPPRPNSVTPSELL